MKRLFLLFLLMVTSLSHAQESQDSEKTETLESNTLEVMGFSVLDETVSDSLTVASDSLFVEEVKEISRIDSLLFLSFRLPKPEILKDIVLDTLQQKTDSLQPNLPPRFKYMNDIGLNHDSRFLSGSLIIQLLDSFSVERTRFKLRLLKMRAIAQKTHQRNGGGDHRGL